LRRGEWLKRELLGSELFGKTLGVIGLGRSGAALAVRAQALGMTVLACDPYINKERFIEYQVQEAEKDVILRQSDFISLHVPLTKETHHLLNEDAFAIMKSSARVISVSRGGVIDEEALLDALDRDQIAGAALDVFEIEPPEKTRLISHPKVVLSPHIGGQTQEAQARVSRDIAEEVLNALTGRELRWRVQPNG
jgi:D-3-phosphoglycerate dehydrogenase